MLTDGEQLLAGVTVGVDARVTVAEGELEQRAFERQRGAQFVGGVRDELTLGIEGRLESGQQSVEGGPELLELVVRPFESESAVEVASGDLAGGVCSRPGGPRATTRVRGGAPPAAVVRPAGESVPVRLPRLRVGRARGLGNRRRAMSRWELRRGDPGERTPFAGSPGLRSITDRSRLPASGEGQGGRTSVACDRSA